MVVEFGLKKTTRLKSSQTPKAVKGFKKLFSDCVAVSSATAKDLTRSKKKLLTMHTILNSSSSNKLEVKPEEPHYCKVEITDSSGPCKLFFTSVGDLNVQSSLNHP
jgi:hypothetical protein